MAVCGINAQLLTEENNYRKAGIHVYLSEVLRNLPTHEHLEYKTFSSFAPPANSRADIAWSKTNPITTNPLGRILWEQLVWPLRSRFSGCDLIHGAAFSLPVMSTLPSVVTIFDLSFIYFPELFPTFRRLYLQWATRVACKKATKIITISDASRQDIIRLFGISEEKIAVVYPGTREMFIPPQKETVEAFRKEKKLPARFVLHVGTLQPRKNLKRLVEAYHQANPKDVDLVFAGGKGWFYEEIFQTVQALGIEDRVHFPGYVPDSDLSSWYAAADLLVFPSVYEGFGMPIVEAMSCGTPVMASNASAMPEAVGDAGVLFDPTNTAELAGTLEALLDNPDKLLEMSQRGLLQAQKFSWQKAGEETLAVYLDALDM